MKRLWLLLAIALFSGIAAAQQGNTSTIPFSGAPSGTCGPLMLGLNLSTGALSDCLTGSWNTVGGGGGGGTVTSVTGTANQVAVATGTTTPVLSLATNIIPPGTLDTITVYASAQAGADWVAKVNACLAALPTNGVCDARGLNGTQTSSSATTVAINADQTLLLGVGTYSSSANPVFTLDADTNLIGLAKTSTLVSATASGATIWSIVGGTAHNNITVSGITFSNTNSNGIGADITGMQRSVVSDVRFQQVATGINCNSQTVNSLYDDFYHVFVSPAASGTGISLRGICNALQFYSPTVIGGANGVVLGNTGDSINPNQDGFFGFDSESQTTDGVDIEKAGPGISFSGSTRFESDATGVFVNSNCTNIYGIVIRDAYFSTSNTTQVTNPCTSVTIRENGQAPNLDYSDGWQLGNPVNLAPSTQNFTGANALSLWQSFNSTTLPSGTAITKVTTPLVSGTLHANSAEVGDGAAAFSGMATVNKINVDSSFPYTISFTASADTNSTTFRPVFYLYDSAGALITTGTGYNTQYSATTGGPTTGSLGYNKTGYAGNFFSIGGDLTVTTANTYQRYVLGVRFPAAAKQVLIGLATNTTHHIFVDELSFIPGTAPAQQFLSELATGPELDLGRQGVANGVLGLAGSTSGLATITAPATAGTTTNPVVSSNAWESADGTRGAVGLRLTTSSAGWYYGANWPAWVFSNGSNADLFAIKSNGNSVGVNSTTVYGWGSSTTVLDAASGNQDTGLSRDSAGVVDIGNGTQGDKSGIVKLTTLTATGAVSGATYASATNCSSAATPAVCAAAAAGSVALPTGTNPTLVVNTTAVTANSQIFLTVDEGLGTKLSVTCNTTLSTLLNPVVTARSAGVSFTFTIGAIIASNPACVSYFIVN